MRSGTALTRARRLMIGGAGIAAAGYAAYVATTWLRYGRPARAGNGEADDLLDRFMPVFDIVERHHTAVAAPAAITLAAAKEMQLMSFPVVGAIFKARALLLGAGPDMRDHRSGIVDETVSLGWGVLADVPDREIVIGAVTKPWEPNVTFRALPPEAFASFAEPGYVKIAWTLRADPDGPAHSTFRTETRAAATDAAARAKFRSYWSFLSPGILLIRRLSLKPLKAEAERRAHGIDGADAS